MKKRMTALVLSVLFLLSLCPLFAHAEGSARVVAESCTASQGGYAYVYLRADQFLSVGTLDIDIYYDPSVMTLHYANTASLFSSASVSTNTATAGLVRVSAMSLSGLSSAGSSYSDRIMSLCFRIHADCPEGDYPVTVTVGDAYDVDLNPAAISGVSGVIAVAKASPKSFPISTSLTASSPAYEESFTLSIYHSSSSYYAFASGDFYIEYDRELLRLLSVTPDAKLLGEGMVHSINSANPGLAVISFASTHPFTASQLFKLEFQVIGNLTASTEIKVSASNVYTDDFLPYAPYTTASTVYLTEQETLPDYPDLSLKAEKALCGLPFSAELILQGGAAVAAGDFTLHYNPELFQVNEVTAAEEALAGGALVVINQSFSNGQIRFSYVNQKGSFEEDVALIKLVMTPLSAPEFHPTLSLSGIDVCDLDLLTVELDYLSVSPCIYASSVTPPTCTEDGKITYACHCGQFFEEKGEDATGHLYSSDCDLICNVCSAPRQGLAEHSYDNACDPLCDLCGNERTITHDYSSRDKSETQHWLKCAVCSVVDEASRTPHGYDNACDPTCNTCGNERAITHDYSSRDKSETQHWLKCAVCSVVDESSREAHGYDHACDPTCNTCGNVRTITHGFSVRDKNDTEHWLKCAVCSVVDEASREAHGYDNACDTVCNTCGNERAITHDFSVRDKNDTEHWLKCAVCSVVDEASRETHGYDHACDTVCDTCGNERAITHDFSARDKSETQHWLKCAVCSAIDESSREAHSYDHACDTTCNTCGNVRTITHDFSARDKSETQHWLKCSVCSVVDEASREAHGYDHACDTVCNTCGNERAITHDFSVRDKSETQHWLKCAVCSVVDESSREAHSYDHACDTTCDTCGNARAITHDYDNACDALCNVCGDERSVPDHVYDDTEDLTCNECGFQRPPYLLGDVNDSKTVDPDDAIHLLFHVMFPERYTVNQPADFNDDGSVDPDDAIYLLFHVMFPERYPLERKSKLI